MSALLLSLPLDAITPSRWNPRTTFDDIALAELAESIRTQGVLEPVLVRPNGAPDRFELVAGERPKLDTLPDADLVRQIVALLLYQEMRNGGKPAALIETARRLKLAPQAIRKGGEASAKPAKKGGKKGAPK